MATVELLCLGNELLIGRTVNTNAAYIGLELAKLGYRLRRIVTVGDYVEDIHVSLREFVSHRPDVIIVMGGLGPTHDDIQFEALSSFLKRNLELNEVALKMIADRMNVAPDQVGESRRKMAMMPKGSIPLKNLEGTAPGAMFEAEGILWFSLPGVPREMKSIFTQEILPQLISRFGKAQLAEIGFNLYGVGESRISQITKEMVKKYPQCYFKSHPKKNGDYWLAMHVYSTELDVEEVKKIAQEWREIILQQYKVEASEPEPVFNENFNPEMYEL